MSGDNARPSQQISRGEQYDHEDYGEVQVMELSRRIDTVDENGVVEETIVVQFLTNPGSKVVTDPDLKTQELDEFLRGVSSE